MPPITKRIDKKRIDTQTANARSRAGDAAAARRAKTGLTGPQEDAIRKTQEAVTQAALLKKRDTLMRNRAQNEDQRKDKEKADRFKANFAESEKARKRRGK